MAIPVVASVGTAATGNGSSITTNAPSGVSVGDELVLCVTLENALVGTITTPTGWTQIDNQVSTNTRLGIYHRIADGTAADTPTVTCSAQDYIAIIHRITGASSAPLDATVGTQNAIFSTAAVSTITTSQANDIAFLAICCSDAITTDPPTWTSKSDTTNNANHLKTYVKDAATAGSYGGETWGVSVGGFFSQVTTSFKEVAAVLSDVAQMMEAVSQQRHNRRRGVRGVSF